MVASKSFSSFLIVLLLTLHRASARIWSSTFKKSNSQDEKKVPTAKLHNGIEIPLIGLGGSNGVRTEHIKSALEIGYRLVDTARGNVTGYHEEDVGVALDEYYKKRNADKVFVQTKIHPEDLGYSATINAVHASLERLKGNLDAVLIHRAHCANNFCEREPEGTWQESWKALEDLYDEGLIKAIGICDVTYELFDELLQQRIKPHIIQSTYKLILLLENGDCCTD